MEEYLKISKASRTSTDPPSGFAGEDLHGETGEEEGRTVFFFFFLGGGRTST